MNSNLKRMVELSLYDYGSRNNQKKLYESFIKLNDINRYSHRLSEMISLYHDSINLNESNEKDNILSLINNNDFEINNINEFRKSLTSGNRGEFLSDYSENDYGLMKTYKVKGFNVGFAIKNDGDIISVHNNSNIGGIGGALIDAAKRFGGTKLDHFDGFLTGFYKKNGFHVIDSDEWNDDYAPLDWKYESIDIYNPQTSIYANELKKYNNENYPDHLKHKIELYSKGMPDIVYRKL